MVGHQTLGGVTLSASPMSSPSLRDRCIPPGMQRPPEDPLQRASAEDLRSQAATLLALAQHTQAVAEYAEYTGEDHAR